MTWPRTIAFGALWLILFGFIVVVVTFLPTAIRNAEWISDHCTMGTVWVEKWNGDMKEVLRIGCSFRFGNNDFIRRQVIRESAQKPARHRGDRQTLAGRRSGFGSGARALDLVHGDQESSRPGPSVRRRPHEAAGRTGALGDRHSHGKPLSRTYRPDERMTTIPMAYLYPIVTHSGWNRAGRLGRYIRRNACLGECPLAEPNSERGPVKSGAITATVQMKGLWTLANLILPPPTRAGISTGIVNKPGSERARKVAATSKRGRLEFLLAGGQRRCGGVEGFSVIRQLMPLMDTRIERRSFSQGAAGETPPKGDRGVATGPEVTGEGEDKTRRRSTPILRVAGAYPARTYNIEESRQGETSELDGSPPGQTREGLGSAAAEIGPQHLGCRRAKRTSHGLPIVTPCASGHVLILTGQGPEPSGPAWRTGGPDMSRSAPDARGWLSGAAFEIPRGTRVPGRLRPVTVATRGRSRGAPEFSREASRPV